MNGFRPEPIHRSLFSDVSEIAARSNIQQVERFCPDAATEIRSRDLTSNLVIAINLVQMGQDKPAP